MFGFQHALLSSPAYATARKSELLRYFKEVHRACRRKVAMLAATRSYPQKELYLEQLGNIAEQQEIPNHLLSMITAEQRDQHPDRDVVGC